MESIRELTKGEEQVMKVLWQLAKGSIKEVTDRMPEPKLAYNTVATVLKVLKSKGFVSYEADGTAFAYYPLIAEKDYRHFAFDKILNGYFDNSYQRLLSFLVEEKNLDQQTQDKLLQLAEQLKDK
jgi:BlaI family penicillinase repressor